MSSLIVYHRHCRALLYCNKQLRVWFQDQGFDWADFLENGILAEKLLATGNAMVLPVVELAKKEVGE